MPLEQANSTILAGWASTLGFYITFDKTCYCSLKFLHKGSSRQPTKSCDVHLNSTDRPTLKQHLQWHICQCEEDICHRAQNPAWLFSQSIPLHASPSPAVEDGCPPTIHCRLRFSSYTSLFQGFAQ